MILLQFEDQRPKKKPQKRPSAASAKKKSKKQESEEGEISSEAASEASEFDDGYDENLIGDDDDRAKLETMTEREREEILFKRAEDREYAKKQFEIRKKLKQKEKFKVKNKEIGNEQIFLICILTSEPVPYPLESQCTFAPLTDFS